MAKSATIGIIERALYGQERGALPMNPPAAAGAPPIPQATSPPFAAAPPIAAQAPQHPAMGFNPYLQPKPAQAPLSAANSTIRDITDLVKSIGELLNTQPVKMLMGTFEQAQEGANPPHAAQYPIREGDLSSPRAAPPIAAQAPPPAPYNPPVSNGNPPSPQESAPKTAPDLKTAQGTLAFFREIVQNASEREPDATLQDLINAIDRQYFELSERFRLFLSDAEKIQAAYISYTNIRFNQLKESKGLNQPKNTESPPAENGKDAETPQAPQE